MVKFNPELLVVKYEMLSSISPALGGSMKLATYDDNDLEIITRVVIPFAVARAWKEEYKTTQYMVPIPVAVVYYDGIVVTVEKGPNIPAYMLDDPEQYGSLFDKDKLFTARVESNITHLKKTLNDTWHTDGYMMYQLPVDIKSAFDSGEALPLTVNEQFKSYDVPTIKFSELNIAALVENPTNHTIVMIKNASGDVFTTPPIFKNIAEMRNSKLTTDEGKDDAFRFDIIDKLFDVNMEFALNAGKKVGKIFGNKAVSPLRLPQLMIALTTVNLPNIRTSVRSTFPMGMTFLQAYAWVTGLMQNTTDLNHMIELRALMKLLCQKGIFKKNTMERVFRKDESGKLKHTVPKIMSVDELKAHVAGQTEAQRILTVDKILRIKKSDKNSDVATGMDID